MSQKNERLHPSCNFQALLFCGPSFSGPHYHHSIIQLWNIANSLSQSNRLSDPHARVHRVFTGSEHSYQRWQRDWPRDQCVTVAQVRTGHSPLVAAYLHRIEHRDSAICPHCHSADETVKHLVFQCSAHDHARRDTWPGDTFTINPRRLWSYMERIGVVTRPPPPGMRERERERVTDLTKSSLCSCIVTYYYHCMYNSYFCTLRRENSQGQYLAGSRRSLTRYPSLASSALWSPYFACTAYEASSTAVSGGQ